MVKVVKDQQAIDNLRQKINVYRLTGAAMSMESLTQTWGMLGEYVDEAAEQLEEIRKLVEQIKQVEGDDPRLRLSAAQAGELNERNRAAASSRVHSDPQTEASDGR